MKTPPLLRRTPAVWFLAVAGLLGLLGLPAAAQAPALPDAPRRHVEDAAGMLTPDARQRLVRRLEEFEKSDGTQVVLWTRPSLPPGTTLEEHVHRVFQHWKIGEKGRDNGVLFAVFRDDRRMRIEVGYGLEGSLTDAVAGRIISEQVAPLLRAGKPDQALEAGVEAILSATRGEYRSGSRDRRIHLGSGDPNRFGGLRGRNIAGIVGVVLGIAARLLFWRPLGFGSVLRGAALGGAGHAGAMLLAQLTTPWIGLFVLMIVWAFLLSRERSYLYGNGSRTVWDTGWGSGWGSGSGWGGGSGGGFSGGGGSSGGGGASGGW